MIKEQVLNALSVLGFIPVETGDADYSFNYEGLRLLYSVSAEKARCVTLVAPEVSDISDDNCEDVVRAMVLLCAEIMFVQPRITSENKVSINYQHYLGDNEVTVGLIEHMVTILSVASSKFSQIINVCEHDS